MLAAHKTVAVALIAACAAAAFTGSILYWRGRGAGGVTTHLLAFAQTLLVAQVAIGLLLLSDGRRSPDQLHYLYGSLALGVALAPWFYAPAAGPRRLLWFSGMTALAATLGIRAYMTGS